MSGGLAALDVEAVALDGGGFELRSQHRDWLLAVFRSFSLRADAHRAHLRVGAADLDVVERVVGAALSPASGGACPLRRARASAAFFRRCSGTSVTVGLRRIDRTAEWRVVRRTQDCANHAP